MCIFCISAITGGDEYRLSLTICLTSSTHSHLYRCKDATLTDLQSMQTDFLCPLMVPKAADFDLPPYLIFNVLKEPKFTKRRHGRQSTLFSNTLSQFWELEFLKSGLLSRRVKASFDIMYV